MRVAVRAWAALIPLLMAWAPPAASASSDADVLQVRRMSASLARDIADAAVTACRDKGYQVSAVVVDRDGLVQAVLRDVFASRFTMEIAEHKANAVILSGIDSRQFRANRADVREEMNHVSGVLMLAGGVPIEAAGALLGAVGVSGAAGGDEDARCATAGVDAVRDRLQLVE